MALLGTRGVLKEGQLDLRDEGKGFWETCRAVLDEEALRLTYTATDGLRCIPLLSCVSVETSADEKVITLGVKEDCEPEGRLLLLLRASRNLDATSWAHCLLRQMNVVREQELLSSCERTISGLEFRNSCRQLDALDDLAQLRPVLDRPEFRPLLLEVARQMHEDWVESQRRSNPDSALLRSVSTRRLEKVLAMQDEAERRARRIHCCRRRAAGETFSLLTRKAPSPVTRPMSGRLAWGALRVSGGLLAWTLRGLWELAAGTFDRATGRAQRRDADKQARLAAARERRTAQEAAIHAIPEACDPEELLDVRIETDANAWTYVEEEVFPRCVSLPEFERLRCMVAAGVPCPVPAARPL